MVSLASRFPSILSTSLTAFPLLLGLSDGPWQGLVLCVISRVPVKEEKAVVRIRRVPGWTVSSTGPDRPPALLRPHPLPPQGSRSGFPSRATPYLHSPYHLHSLQARSPSTVPLDRHPKLPVTSCVKATEVQRGQGSAQGHPASPGAAGRLRVGRRTHCLVLPPPGWDHGADRWPCLGQVRACEPPMWETQASPCASSLIDPNAWDSTDRGSRLDPSILR